MAIIPGMPSSAKGHTKLEKRSELMPIHHLLPLPVHRLSKSPRHGRTAPAHVWCSTAGGVSDHGAHAATSPQIMPLSPDSPAWMLMHELSGQAHIPPRQSAYAQFRIPPLLIHHHARWGGGSKLNLPSFILIDLAKKPFLASTAAHPCLDWFFSSNRG